MQLHAAGVAGYTLPERLELVDELGKIDKKALRADAAARLEESPWTAGT